MLCLLRALPQTDLGVWTGPTIGVSRSGTSGQHSGTGTHSAPHLSLGNVR